MGKRDRHKEFRRSWARYCTYCGVKLCQDHRRKGQPACDDEATWDHLIVHQRGLGVIGRDKVVACFACNNDRGDKGFRKWMKSLRQRLQDNLIRVEYLEKAIRVLDGHIPPRN